MNVFWGMLCLLLMVGVQDCFVVLAGRLYGWSGIGMVEGKCARSVLAGLYKTTNL